jgi:hypothetical protein
MHATTAESRSTAKLPPDIAQQLGKWRTFGNLACAGSHAINGVAELHTRLLKEFIATARRRITRAEFLDEQPLWPSAFWAAVIVLVLFPVVVGGITLLAWTQGTP